jgi:hypothetical protein
VQDDVSVHVATVIIFVEEDRKLAADISLLQRISPIISKQDANYRDSVPASTSLTERLRFYY